MNNRENSNLGDDIKKIIDKAVNNKDFKKLNKDIGSFVNRNLNKKTINRKKLFAPVGKVSSLLFTIFGIIGTTLFGIGVFVLLVLGLLPGAKTLFTTIAIILAPFLLISIILLIKGSSHSKRLKRFEKYIQHMKMENFILIEDLALSTKTKEKELIRDLDIMINKGMFPQGHIDEEKKYFILDDQTYKDYLDLKKNMARKDLERPKKDENYKTDPEIQKSIDQGRDFILQIKKANLAIPGKEISNKLDRLEELTEKIFDYVENHPEKLHQIKKFTEYFLPTSLKLVETYKKLDYQSIEGENISKIKKEIEETMDTINLAFENLLDDLFQDLAMDISTDISVLETIFAQEGLTENNMKINKETRREKNE